MSVRVLCCLIGIACVETGSRLTISLLCVLFAHHLVLMGTGPGSGRFVARVVAAVLVMLVYLGALAVSFALLEVS